MSADLRSARARVEALEREVERLRKALENVRTGLDNEALNRLAGTGVKHPTEYATGAVLGFVESVLEGGGKAGLHYLTPAERDAAGTKAGKAGTWLPYSKAGR